MRVFIAGIDGYLGWSLAVYLATRGHEIGGCDIFARRKWVKEMGSHSAIPIASMPKRIEAFREHFRKPLHFFQGNLLNYDFVKDCIAKFEPEAIVHLGEMPSAPYSMKDVHHAVYTMNNNIIGSLHLLYAIKEHCPQAHLVKLGTMGEYGTPNVDIPEGIFEIEYRGRKDTLPFPRQAGSWYHQTKVHDTNNIMMACRFWGICSTDIMQGVVYGTRIDEMEDNPFLRTRFDFDEAFGTVINRFCACSVIGHPLTPYGVGHQKRGFLPLRDSMQCLTLAIINPPHKGEYRTFNQFEEVYSVHELADRVAKVANNMGLKIKVHHTENPRLEKEEHYYNPDHRHLLDLGYKPTHNMEDELLIVLTDLLKHKNRIERKRSLLLPKIRWNGTLSEVNYIPNR